MKVRIEFDDGDDVSYHDRMSFFSNAVSDTTDAMLKFVKCFNTRQPEYVVADLINNCLDPNDLWMWLSPETKAEIIGEINDEAEADSGDDPDEES